MFVLRSKYDKLVSEKARVEALLEDERKDKRRFRNEVMKLERTLDSVNVSNVIPYSKAKDGDLVMNSAGFVYKVLKVGTNWILNTNVRGRNLEIDTPARFDAKFGSGPVSKKDLIEYMKEQGYRD